MLNRQELKNLNTQRENIQIHRMIWRNNADVDFFQTQTVYLCSLAVTVMTDDYTLNWHSIGAEIFSPIMLIHSWHITSCHWKGAWTAFEEKLKVYTHNIVHLVQIAQKGQITEFGFSCLVFWWKTQHECWRAKTL